MADKLGIIAGGGDLPAALARFCLESERPYFIVAFEGQTDPDLVADKPHGWFRLGAAGEAIDRLKKEGVAEVVMAGPMKRPSLAELKPDLWTLKTLSKIGFSSLGDDGLLGGIVRILEEQGFRIIGADDLLRQLLAPEGCYGQHRPDPQGEADIQRGIAVARALGAVDVGQSVVVQQGLVLGVEAVEGTDALLERCAGLRRDGPGGVLVKLKKPNQERRVDLPTIGKRTLDQAKKAGLAGIAVEAGGALVLDRDGLTARADAEGLFLIGISAPS